MFEVIKQEINNPFKPEVIDSTTIILKQRSPFVHMSRNYEGDLTDLTDEEAIEKVLRLLEEKKRDIDTLKACNSLIIPIKLI